MICRRHAGLCPGCGQDQRQVLSVCELGYAKRSDFADYRTQARGGKGIINVKITEKNGLVVGSCRSVMGMKSWQSPKRHGRPLLSFEIRETGRSAVGVRLISMEAGGQALFHCACR